MKKNHSKTITYELFVGLAIVDTITYVLEKIAVVQSGGSGIMFYVNMLIQPWLWTGLGLALLQLLLWLKILNKNDLSLAYPVTSLSTPTTMLIAQLYFKEHLSVQVWLGTILISIGIILISSKKDRIKSESTDDKLAALEEI
jgi:drug/metabolite transporter (DMT)-like permease